MQSARKDQQREHQEHQEVQRIDADQLDSQHQEDARQERNDMSARARTLPSTRSLGDADFDMTRFSSFERMLCR
jgi:hypothetical protein